MSAIGSLSNRVSRVATASAGPEPCSASLPSTISAERQCARDQFLGIEYVQTVNAAGSPP
jgi:hypothetical protein